MVSNRFMDGDLVLLKRGKEDTYKKGMIEVHEGIAFFVSKNDFTVAIEDSDEVIVQGVVSIKLERVPIGYKYIARELGMSLTQFAMMCMEEKIRGIKGYNTNTN